MQVNEYWKRLIPMNAVDIIEGILSQHSVVIRVSKHRATKHGDFRAYVSNRTDVITVNGSLEPNGFLMTLIHEIAHKVNWDRYGSMVEPHGKEWKFAMKEILVKTLGKDIWDKNLENAISIHLNNWKATNHRMKEVHEALLKIQGIDFLQLNDIPDGVEFTLESGQSFVKLKKLRTYFLCEEKTSKRQYRVHQLAKVVSYKGE